MYPSIHFKFLLTIEYSNKCYAEVIAKLITIFMSHSVLQPLVPIAVVRHSLYKFDVTFFPHTKQIQHTMPQTTTPTAEAKCCK